MINKHDEEIKSKISVCGGLSIIDMAYDKYTARGYYTFQFFYCEMSTM